MKKLLSLIVLIFIISFYNCGKKKSDKTPETITIKTKSEEKKESLKTAKLSAAETALIAKGQQLFKDKTCFACHQPNTKIIGPSIIDINKVYKEKNADIIAFLKGELSPIVDTDPGQVTIMKANLDSFVKNLKDDELRAIKAYMISVK